MFILPVKRRAMLTPLAKNKLKLTVTVTVTVKLDCTLTTQTDENNGSTMNSVNSL